MLAHLKIWMPKKGFTLFEDNLSPASLHDQPPLCKVPGLSKVYFFLPFSHISSSFWFSHVDFNTVDVSYATCSNGPPMARLDATKMPIVKNVWSIFVSKVLSKSFSQLNVLVGMRIEGPSDTFYPAAFWNPCLIAGVTKVRTRRVDISVFIILWHWVRTVHFNLLSGKVFCVASILLDIARPVALPSSTFLGNFRLAHWTFARIS